MNKTQKCPKYTEIPHPVLNFRHFLLLNCSVFRNQIFQFRIEFLYRMSVCDPYLIHIIFATRFLDRMSIYDPKA